MAQARTLLYKRLAAHQDGFQTEDLAGLFTRPPELAVWDEENRLLPVRALNRACRLLAREETVRCIEKGREGVELPEDVLRHIAETCGFPSLDDFSDSFEKGTGWKPEEWAGQFGRRSRDDK